MSAGDNDGRDFNAKDGLTRIWYAVERVTDKKKAWFRKSASRESRRFPMLRRVDIVCIFFRPCPIATRLMHHVRRR